MKNLLAISIAAVAIASLLAMPVGQAFAATMELKNPKNGDTVPTQGKVPFVIHFEDFPEDRVVTYTFTIRDKETGDVIDSKTITSDDKKVDYAFGVISSINKTGKQSEPAGNVILQLEGDQLEEDRTLTFTVTVRDLETGDELVGGTIEFTPS